MNHSSADKMRSVADLPHLIHIGFPKAGSTFLQDWFAGHPQIAYKPGGLAGMWNIYDLINASTHPAGNLRCRVTSAEQIAYPLAPDHFGSTDPAIHESVPARSEAVCAALARQFPDAHILIITRGFAPLLKSGYSELVRNGSHLVGREYLGNFGNLMSASSGADALVRGYDYDTTIALYHQHFAGRVLALPFELLVEDRRGFMGIIERTMKLDSWDGPNLNVNPSLTPEELYWYPRLAKMLVRVRPGRLSPRLLALHVRAIKRGWWNPVIGLLRLVAGKRSARLDVPPELLEQLALTCRNLVNLPHYQPYRNRYLNRPE